MANEFSSATVHDQSLQYIVNNTTKLTVTKTAPANYTAALDAGTNIGEVTVSGANFTGPVDNGDGRRKITLNTVSGVTGQNGGGTALYLNFLDVTGTELLHTKPVTSFAVTNAVAFNINPSDIILGTLTT